MTHLYLDRIFHTSKYVNIQGCKLETFIFIHFYTFSLFKHQANNFTNKFFCDFKKLFFSSCFYSMVSRSSSVRESTYSRTGRASSISRTSSFADRSYGTRTSLARKSSFSIADYSSAVRRSSVFDGYAGYSIYSSIREDL